MPTIPEAFAVAVQHHQAGRLQAAEQVYRQILAADPNHPDAWHLLGILSCQIGKHQAGGECIQRALALRPDWVDAIYNLGNAWKAQGNLEKAVAYYERAAQLNPNIVEAHYSLGNAWRERGNLDEAAACYQRALRLRPDHVEAHNNLGNVRKDQGMLDEAAACFQCALQLKPDYAEAHNNLGIVWNDRRKPDEAKACYERALQLKPDYAEAYNNLGIVLNDRGKLDEAVACYLRALELKPDYVEAHTNLGNARKDQGLLDEALCSYQRALQLKPDYVTAHSNLVYLLYFCPQYDARTIYEEHRQWNKRYAEPLARHIQPHANDRSADRRLRVGYVSPDFRSHPVGRFILPLLEAHDHSQVEIFCYAALTAPDRITQRCRACADVWRDIVGASDEQAADTIRRDGIDVLVDLTMHMANSRLLVFARKPAPVQITYLAYCGTTGLTTMDYRLTDPYLDPSGGDESCYSEQSVRLPETYWCYKPPAEIPKVNRLPALETWHFTFGCLNNFSKVTAPTLEAWVRILQALPDARLVLHAHPGSHRERLLGFLAGRGISTDRLTFAATVGEAEYFRTYGRIDLALDPFPYNGGTTTCDALIMGVPVISLAGDTAVGRGGLSILSNVGLAELVANDVAEYERIAVELANDLPRLSRLRAGLRERMRLSPLMHADRFARNIEATYRNLWRRWCAT